MVLTAEVGLRAYAAMMNTLDVSKVEPLLADEFHYASQFVLCEIESRVDYLTYITHKLQTVTVSGNRVWAEMGWLDSGYPGPCVVLAQGEKDALVGLVVAKVSDGKIERLDLCAVPTPQSARRSGEYPA